MGREKGEIWQVGCRAVSKRDTSFSAWLRDNDELQIRMNEKVLRNLSATLQRLMLCQGCMNTHPYFPAENAIHISYSSVITSHLVMQNKCPWNDFCIKLEDKTKHEISLLHKARAAHMMFCVMALFPTSGSSQKAQKRYKRIEFITGCRASIRGALCLQSATANPFKSWKEREKSSTFKDNVKEKCTCTERRAGVKTTPKNTLKAFNESAYNWVIWWTPNIQHVHFG